VRVRTNIEHRLYGGICLSRPADFRDCYGSQEPPPASGCFEIDGELEFPAWMFPGRSLFQRAMANA
jgi:hypothetical protein